MLVFRRYIFLKGDNYPAVVPLSTLKLHNCTVSPPRRKHLFTEGRDFRDFFQQVFKLLHQGRGKEHIRKETYCEAEFIFHLKFSPFLLGYVIMKGALDGES